MSIFAILGLAFLVAAPASVYLLHKTQVCLFYGRAMASRDFLESNPKGFQDAITDPRGNKWFFLFQGILFVTIVSYFYFGGWVTGLLSIAAFFLTFVIVRRLLPAENSPVWAKGLYASLCRREADYKRDGDELRYEAMKSLREDFQAVFQDEIVPPAPRA